MAKKKYKNGEEYYNKIYTLFNLSVAITLLPFGYLVLEKHSGDLVSMPIDEWKHWVISLPVVIALGWIMWRSQQNFKEDKKAAKSVEGLRNKLDAFQQLLSRRFAIYTGIGAVCTMMLYLTGSGLFIMAYVASMILLSLSRPTLNLIIDELGLSEEEEKIIMEKREIE
ncbi:hypothetical protein [Reichenbachiella ulvae]|uniref:Uncharacterized protein n=1 Tax=Reichenbachiella ulvae TaxID=2980104 RepID=A0ABT3CP85_9BACT|nr:hypothetical protein [Reichenbachiella ulvae]MCV9385339.1 hypothetical protein [Reichenbachiella ulvae]